MAIMSHTHQSSLELGGLSPLVSIAGGVAVVTVDVDSVVVVDDVVLEPVSVVLEPVSVVLVAVIVVKGHGPIAVKF